MIHPLAKPQKILTKHILVAAKLVLGGLFLLCVPSGFAVSNVQLQIHFSNNQLSVVIENTPLINVLEKLQIAAGLEFSIAEKAAQLPINAQFDSMPLEIGLKTILNGFNYSILYGPNNSLQKVTVLRSMASEMDRELQPTQTKSIHGTGLSGEERSAPSLSESRMEQKIISDRAETAFPSDAVMRVHPPNSGGMVIEKTTQPMQIDPPQSDDAMKMDIPPTLSE
jgi:hypothetical protein